MTSLDDFDKKYPPDDMEEYREGYFEAGLDGDVVQLAYDMLQRSGVSYAELAERANVDLETLEGIDEVATKPDLLLMAKIALATRIPLRLVADGVGEVDLAADRYPED